MKLNLAMKTIALTFQLLHLLYHQITTNVDLYPFNNIKSYTFKERFVEAGFNFVMMSIPVAATLVNNKTFIGVSVLCLLVTLTGEIIDWWIPYFFDCSGRWHQWHKQAYERIHKHTIIILPPIKDHPIPNLEHMILHGLTIVTFILTTILYFSL